jgi:uncharacterized glyoxalase superfamily protein PhnB
MSARRKTSTRARKTTRRRTTHHRTSAPSHPRTLVSASGLAPGMQSINTYLAVANIAASIEFLERAFGFARGVVLPDADGRLRYAEMRHGDSVVVLVQKGDATAPTGGGPGLYAYVDDVDRALALAREAGAGAADAEDKPWGDRAAVVTDPDGYRWVLATFKKLVPFAQG